MRAEGRSQHQTQRGTLARLPKVLGWLGATVGSPSVAAQLNSNPEVVLV